LLAALTAIWAAKSRRAVYLSGLVGITALYFMINPAKASFSIAPTMIVCAIVGYLTSALAYAPNRSHRIIAAATAGLLLGLAVSFRLPNLFLSAGYFVVLLTLAFRSGASEAIRLVAFGVAYALGLAPTLIANAINAGSVFATTYGGADAVQPDFSFSIAGDYIRDMQGSLIILTAVWTAFAVLSSARKVVASIVAVNLIANLAFFLSHPIFTPYYLMPLAMLSIWTLLATTVTQSELSPALSSSPVALPTVS
jgi:hypothetical protein